jgi:hypothetical protein
VRRISGTDLFVALLYCEKLTLSRVNLDGPALSDISSILSYIVSRKH